MKSLQFNVLIIFFLFSTLSMRTTLSAQRKLIWNELPDLPGKIGWAGMYAGTSKGLLFCMGGANFPDKLPWKGGKKLWYDDIYMLQEGRNWIKIKQKLPQACAYGISITYKESIVLVGGGDKDRHFNSVISYTWKEDHLELVKYPNLPCPLAFMAGTLVNNLIVIAGGIEYPGGPNLRKCFGLDLENIQAGWFEIDPWPGPERNLSVAAAYKGQFYLFSGETIGVSTSGEKFPLILQDAFRLTLLKSDESWLGRWLTLSTMPKGTAAAGSPLPVLDDGSMVFWGGVDALTRLHKDPTSIKGIPGDILLYSPEKDIWEYAASEKMYPARVTLPVVYWKDQWVFISGETRPGVRTLAVTSIADSN